MENKITAEMLKADIDLSARTLTDLFGKIWRQEKIPMESSRQKETGKAKNVPEKNL